MAEATRGFMPRDEGEALYEAACSLGSRRDPDVQPVGPLLEVGTYCGKSAVYLGGAARELGTVLYTVDHHRGSEENQAGWEHHDHELVDPGTGRIDTLPFFRRAVAEAGLEDVVVAIVGDSVGVARHWETTLGFLFIDGGHGAEPAHADYDGWVPHLRVGGLLAIHDVFSDPADGGRPPYELYCRALGSGAFEELSATGSLRVLRRTGSGQ